MDMAEATAENMLGIARSGRAGQTKLEVDVERVMLIHHGVLIWCPCYIYMTQTLIMLVELRYAL